MITLFRVIEGLALLTLGRKLFWLFVAAIGFEAGALIATRFFTDWIRSAQGRIAVRKRFVHVGLLPDEVTVGKLPLAERPDKLCSRTLYESRRNPGKPKWVLN